MDNIILSLVITLQKLKAKNPSWSLDEFVDVANQLLPQYLSTEGVSGRSQEQVNARLVRHYTGLGLVDRPGRAGKEARYGYRHLLQLLVLRRLLQDGYTSQAIRGVTDSRSDGELEALLQGGARLSVETANPALAFLEQIRARGTSIGNAESLQLHRSMDVSALAGPPRTRGAPTWTRIDLAPGLELHVRSDYVWPGSPAERKHILDSIADSLSRVAGKRRKLK
ncbi:MAG: MerR family transcriptional regulator [Acidobacteria bacterium]|nr:MAG: MerR family transcriptional regulator [Acidobacteriota bacterium]